MTNIERLELAAAWRVRVEADETVGQSQEFLDWFNDPANQEAYAKVCATWDTFEDHQAAPELIAVRRDALDRVRKANAKRFAPKYRALMAIAATLLIAFAGVGIWRYLQQPADYSTGIGERRVVTLDDGSRISLDSDTDVTVQFSSHARTLALKKGRARFDVAHDITRPFSVSAGGETVVAVGTSFNVERLEGKVLVTLIEGHVFVRAASGAQTDLAANAPVTTPKPVSLIAGQELIASASAKPAIQAANLPAATAWESGRLMLNNEPLSEAVARINRYTDKPILVDPTVANLRVSGAFNAGDVSAFIEAITNYFPVEATTSPDNQIVLQKRS
jgi:transmembrane sensor